MTVFDDLDASRWSLGPFGPHAIRVPSQVRSKVLILAALAAALWCLLGFDATWEMIVPLERQIFSAPLTVLPDLLNPASGLRAEMWAQYGIGDHWSALVIYGLAYVWLSRRLEDAGVGGSLNFFATSSLTLLNVGVFEYAYNALYSVFQGQPWTFSLLNKNIPTFTVFILLGFGFALFLREQGYAFKPMGNARLLFLVTLAAWGLWVLYPLPVAQASAETMWGQWLSGPLFPQTFYAVRTGELSYAPVWVQNDLLHLVNVVAKALTAAALASVMAVKKKDI